MNDTGGSVVKFEKVETSGLIVLFIGVIVLAATFYSAYLFLVADITILASVDLAELFGNALAPLIKAVIHVLYLGIMGWIGSILTIRAVQLLKKDKEPSQAQPQPKPETKQNTAPQQQSTKPVTQPQKETKDVKKAENPTSSSPPKPPNEPQQVAASEKPTENPTAPATG